MLAAVGVVVGVVIVIYVLALRGSMFRRGRAAGVFAVASALLLSAAALCTNLMEVQQSVCGVQNHQVV